MGCRAEDNERVKATIIARHFAMKLLFQERNEEISRELVISLIDLQMHLA